MQEVVRGELFGEERLREFARGLAVTSEHAAATPRGSFDPLALLRSSARTIRAACRVIETAAARGRAITPAARWLIENLHVVEEQLTDLPDSLPRRRAQRLPHVRSGRTENSPAPVPVPRIYSLALAYIEHSDSRFESQRLHALIAAYQEARPLLMRELWALPSALRLALLVNLARVASRTAAALAAREQADRVADHALRAGALADTAAPAVAPGPGTAQGPYLLQLCERLRYAGGIAMPALSQLDALLTAQTLTVDQLIRGEHARQSANNVTARNIVTSFREIAAADWREFFEAVSLVERSLCTAHSYVDADHRTRDRYRDAIQELAERSRRAEDEIAHALLAAVQTSPAAPARARDVGYHLIDEGRKQFEQRIGVRPSMRQHLLRWLLPHASGGYVALIVVLTAAILAIAFWVVQAGAGRWPGTLGATIALALFATIPASELALGLLNRLLVLLLPARRLARLALRHGIPSDCVTLVAMPVLIGARDQVEEFVQQLEVQAAANRDPAIRFALLTDWIDAPSETRPDDDVLLETARAGVARLNAADRSRSIDAPQRFFLLHRRRQWNAREGCWMGWERKRGKLEELNALLLRGERGSFVPDADGRIAYPLGVRYVVTLDADTRLPFGAVAQLVGTAAHPLNRPVFDDAGRRVVAGYGIVQPRVVPLLPRHGERSLYRDIVSGGSGLDPYAGAVSDVYQDVFREGIFTGKGLYDLAAFDRAMRGRIPQNTILSHDLLESLYARAALASDIECYEDFPSHSEVAAARQHRWTRGDWQLLPWLFGRRGHDLGLLDRWKLLDNLRRSLLAPASVALLCTAWASGVPSWIALALILSPAILPDALAGAARLTHAAGERSLRAWVRSEAAAIATSLRNALASLALLAQNAWLMCDAIARALVRQLFTRRLLLQWVTAAQLKSQARHGVAAFVWSMKGAAIVVVTAAALLMALRPSALREAAPLLLLWWLTPLIALAVSRSSDDAHRPLAPRAPPCRTLRLVARRTWDFFATHVNAQENHLPPDNLQESPHPVVAHRTSPTNISLYLLSVASARDLGWIGLDEALDRIEATLSSVDRLEQHRGHLYNWYDTRRAAALEPRYVSTVDSGNFCGHCIALARWCEAQRRAPAVPTAAALDGLADTLDLLASALGRLPPGTASGSNASPQELQALIARCTGVLQQARRDAAGVAEAIAALRPLGQHLHELADALSASSTTASEPELADWASRFLAQLSSHSRDLAIGAAPRAQQRLEALALRLLERVERTDFRFLYDERRQLFSIGWRHSDGALDPSFYDLLASEARLASFVAIAKGDVPWRHWRHLGRRLTGPVNRPLLVSWSGSMFEYLMPALVLREPAGGLLDLTARRAVEAQMAYGRSKRIPWGISESAYNVRDAELTYQYSAFGVPGLGLKRGLERNVVIAPYASALAAMYDPRNAVANLLRLERLGARGRFGFYESVDFTAERVPEGTEFEIVRAYMAHHQGMTIVAAAEALGAMTGVATMRDRFHSDPRMQAAELLLEERAPGPAARPRTISDQRIPARVVDESPELERRVLDVATAAPVVHFLSNRRYAVMVTAAGGGYSVCDGRMLTRWREDGTRDALGSFFYLRDLESQKVWSATFQPTMVEPQRYEACFAEERASWSRVDDELHSTLEVVVSTEDDAELRRLTLHNLGSEARVVEVTSYCEVVLAPLAADVAHRAFSNLFVRTEWVGELRGTLLAQRRPRALEETPMWCGITLAAPADVLDTVQYETDRARFVGRNADLTSPLALQPGRALSNTAGLVLDPVFSLRTRVALAPGQSRSLTFATFVCASRESALALADRLRQQDCFERVSMQAWTYARAGLHHLNVDLAEVRSFQTLAGHVVHADARLRAGRETLAANVCGAPALWRFGISGDRPIVLVRCTAQEDLDLVRQLLRAQEYWRSKQLVVDLVLLNERAHSYEQELQIALEEAARVARAWTAGVAAAQRPLVQVLAARTLEPRESTLLLAVARAVIVPAQGSLAEQLERPLITHPIEPASTQVAAVVAERTEVAAPAPFDELAGARGSTPRVAGDRVSSAKSAPADATIAGLLNPASAAANALVKAATALTRGPQLISSGAPPVRDEPAGALEFYNGYGGFAADGREYVIELHEERRPPLPWSNVLANPHFGALVTESGSTFTWSLNSRENQLTPWSNDAVEDSSGEAIYLRDAESGELWSPCPQPISVPQARYRAAHGQGYSQFRASIAGIDSELTVWVDAREPVKWFQLRLTNVSGRVRTLNVAAYVEWVLGFGRARNAPFIVTERAENGALLARNPWNAEFPGRIAWLDLGEPAQQWTGSRREFLGRHGSIARPAALLEGSPLSGRTGAGFDPCAALSSTVRLAPGASRQFALTLGQCEDRAAALRAIEAARARRCDDSLDEVRSAWERRLGALQIKTPDRALDVLVNHWLLYQVTSCRLWARAAFYQVGGAFGFRDQLQDVLALLHVDPQLVRAQLERAAQRQFPEGDVQHWWHPPTGRGVRTRFADDRLWLPYVAAHYLRATNDSEALEIELPFIEGAAVKEGHEDAHYVPEVSTQRGSLYEHCARAIDVSLGAGPHGLPLMGGGDWNDGMNRVGLGGRGESVWMAWFLISTIELFAPIAEARGAEQHERAQRWRRAAEGFRAAAESAGWDGAWYRRAFFDDGTPLGSASNVECRIDAIAQSWAVISGAADAQRAQRAMDAVREFLVRDAEALVLLFTPPFDRSALEPGYVKAYLPGVRENGAQYTHAAVWTLIAFAMQKRRAEVGELVEALNPIRRSATRRGSATYKVEPYVVAADIYSQPPHSGRGGWTWYTGAAGWLYRAVVESVIGVRILHDRLEIAPCLPPGWHECELRLRVAEDDYRIVIESSGDKAELRSVTLDGAEVPADRVPRLRDGRRHEVHVRLA